MQEKIKQNLIDKLEEAGGIYAPNIEHETGNRKFFACKIIGDSIDYEAVVKMLLDEIKKPRFVFFLKIDILESIYHLDPIMLRGIIHYDRIEVLNDN